MIKLPELDSKFTNINDGGNTVRDLRLTRLEEALKNAVSELELKKVMAEIAEKVDDRIKSELEELNEKLKLKADKSELPKPSALEVKVVPLTDNRGQLKQPSLLSEILAIIKNRKK